MIVVFLLFALLCASSALAARQPAPLAAVLTELCREAHVCALLSECGAEIGCAHGIVTHMYESQRNFVDFNIV